MRKRGDSGKAWRNPQGLNGVRVRALAPAQPTRWECLLEELQMTDGDALQALRAQDVAALRVAQFVRRSFGRFFVPEPILAELHLLRVLEQMPVQSLKAGGNVRRGDEDE